MFFPGGNMWGSDKWKDFEILDCSGGEKLERWGAYTKILSGQHPMLATAEVLPAAAHGTKTLCPNPGR